MPAQLANLVHETSTSTGTGNLTTARAGGKQRGSEAFGTGDDGVNNPIIFIWNRDAVAAEWEICPAHWSDANTLVRGTPILSSNANAAVSFGAGVKDVTNALIAAQVGNTLQVLTDGATVNWNLNLGLVAQLTLGGNRTLAAPTNLIVGAVSLIVIQDGTGSRTITWNSVFKWPGGVAPVLSTAIGAKDVFSFICDGTNFYGTYMNALA